MNGLVKPSAGLSPEQIAIIQMFIKQREETLLSTARIKIRELIALRKQNAAVNNPAQITSRESDVNREKDIARKSNRTRISTETSRKVSSNNASNKVFPDIDHRKIGYTISKHKFIANAGSELIAKECLGISKVGVIPDSIDLTNAMISKLTRLSISITREFATKILEVIDCYNVNPVITKTYILIHHGEDYPTDSKGRTVAWTYIKNKVYTTRKLLYDTQMFLRHAKYIHEDMYDYSKTEYIGNGKTTITCPEHGDFELSCRHHLLGYRCPRCRNNDKKDHQYYVKRVTEKYGGRIVINCDDLYQLPVKIRNNGKKTSKREVPMLCAKHNYHFVRDTDSILKDDGGCMRCRGEKLRVIQTRPWEGVMAEFRKIHGDNYNYDQAKFTIMSEKIDIYCKKCKAYFKQTPCHHRLGNGCPMCHASLGETLVRGYLVSNEIKFTPEYRFNDPIVRAYRYDFLIEFAGKQALIEFDGGFHFIDHFKTPGSAVEQQRRDRIKTEFARGNDIPMIRIYWEDVMSCAGPDAKTVRMGEILDDFIEQVDSGFSGTLYTGGYPHEHRH